MLYISILSVHSFMFLLSMLPVINWLVHSAQENLPDSKICPGWSDTYNSLLPVCYLLHEKWLEWFSIELRELCNYCVERTYHHWFKI